MMIRRATTDDIPGLARVHRETWQATYRGMVPDEFLDGLTDEKSTGFWKRIFDNESRPGVEFVALDGDRIVGFVSGGPARDIPGIDGEIYALYLLPDAQGNGTGRELMNRIAEWLRSEGHTSWGVWVLADNPTRTFYSHLGGRPTEVKTISIAGAELVEELYVWDSVDSPAEG